MSSIRRILRSHCAGNRTRMIDGDDVTAYSYNANDELTRVDYVNEYTHEEYEYDARGNLTTVTLNQNGVTPVPISTSFFAYNARDGLISADVPGSAPVTYAYDHRGNRVGQTIGTDTTDYLWDEFSRYGDVLLETTPTDTIAYTLAMGMLISQTKNGNTDYFLQDAQGSTVALADGGTGAVTSSYSYDAFGNLDDGVTLETNYLYTGQQYDATTELYSLRARQYNPTVGRFLTRDKWSYNYQNPVELNRYVYTANNPIKYVDPSGYFGENQTTYQTSVSVASSQTGFQLFQQAYYATAQRQFLTWAVRSLIGSAIALAFGTLIELLLNPVPSPVPYTPPIPAHPVTPPVQPSYPQGTPAPTSTVAPPPHASQPVPTGSSVPTASASPSPSSSSSPSPSPSPTSTDDNDSGLVVILGAGGTGSSYTNEPTTFLAPVSQIAAVMRSFPNYRIISLDFGASGVLDYLSGNNVDSVTQTLANTYGADLSVPPGSLDLLEEIAQGYESFNLGDLQADVVISFYPNTSAAGLIAPTASRLLKPGGQFYGIADVRDIHDTIVNGLQSSNQWQVPGTMPGGFSNPRDARQSFIHSGNNPFGLSGFWTVQQVRHNVYDVFAVKR